MAHKGLRTCEHRLHKKEIESFASGIQITEKRLFHTRTTRISSISTQTCEVVERIHKLSNFESTYLNFLYFLKINFDPNSVSQLLSVDVSQYDVACSEILFTLLLSFTLR